MWAYLLFHILLFDFQQKDRKYCNPGAFLRSLHRILATVGEWDDVCHWFYTEGASFFTINLQNWTINTPGRQKNETFSSFFFLSLSHHSHATPTRQWHLSERSSTEKDDLLDPKQQLKARAMLNSTRTIFRFATNWKLPASVEGWILLLVFRFLWLSNRCWVFLVFFFFYLDMLILLNVEMLIIDIFSISTEQSIYT